MLHAVGIPSWKVEALRTVQMQCPIAHVNAVNSQESLPQSAARVAVYYQHIGSAPS